LVAAAPPTGAPPTYPAPYPPPYAAPPAAYGYGAGPWAYERTKQIDRTKTGVLLLLIGGLIQWVPFIGIVGSLLILIGAILVILGRKAFGPSHSRNVVLAIVFFFGGLIVTVVLVVISAFSSFIGIAQGDLAAAAAAATAAVNNILISAIIGAAIIGLASVFFTYALQKQVGKMLLWAGYGASIALQAAIFLLISPLISDAVAQAISSGTYNAAPITALTNQITTLGLLSAVPALIYAVANYLAWSRISRGEIPAPPAQPPMPAAVSPPWTPPTPPASPPPSGPAPPINPQ
jgi:hypothetical protein